MTTTTVQLNCGCGFLVIGSNTAHTKRNVKQAMVEAETHCSETGHTMEINGAVQP